MAYETLIDATNLATWANRRDAQSRLPQVVRRLVHATAQQPRRIQFRSGEGIQLSGWDGITEAGEDTDYVPAGITGWEMGTEKDVKGKADGDYSTRRLVMRNLVEFRKIEIGFLDRILRCPVI